MSFSTLGDKKSFFHVIRRHCIDISNKDTRKMMGIPEISSYFYMLVGKTENILTELKGNNTNN